MRQTTSINSVLNQISMAAAAANRAGVLVSSSFIGDMFFCVCMQEEYNSTIDLNNPNAYFKLKACLNEIYAFTPSCVANIEGAA